MGKEDIDLAKEHVKLAEDIVLEEANKSSGDSKKGKELAEAGFALEKAESEIQDVEECD